MRALSSSALVNVSSAQGHALALAAGNAVLDENALREVPRQREFLAAVREGAASALDDLMAEIWLSLASEPRFALVRSLPVEHAAGILVALSAGLGSIVEPYNQSWSRVIRHIIPAADKAGGGRTLNEYLHTDGTDWAQPNDYTCLFCIRPDKNGGGRSRLFDVADVMNGVAEAGMIQSLTEQSVPWRLADELGGGVHWAPILQHDSDPAIRWLRYTVAKSWQDGLVSKDFRLDSLMDWFEKLLEASDASYDFALSPGDLLFVDNSRCLHARSEISDPARSGRELLRTKVISDDHDASRPVRP
jgi:Taurine catabolism dioxygenase TauD, TfdA family